MSKTIRDILEPLASGWRGWTIDQLDGTSFIKGEMDAIEETIAKAESDINAYILGEVMELLGEDEPNRPLLQMRNELRQELRNKANEKFGGK